MSDYNQYLAKSGSAQPAQGDGCIATKCPCANEAGGGNGGNNDICPHYPILTIAANLTTLYPPQDTVLLTVAASYYSALSMTITGASGSVTTAITPGVQTLTITETSTVTVVAEGTISECGTVSRHVSITVTEEPNITLFLTTDEDEYCPGSVKINWSAIGLPEGAVLKISATGYSEMVTLPASSGTNYALASIKEGVPDSLPVSNGVTAYSGTPETPTWIYPSRSAGVTWKATITLHAYSALGVELCDSVTVHVGMLPMLEYLTFDNNTTAKTVTHNLCNAIQQSVQAKWKAYNTYDVIMISYAALDDGCITVQHDNYAVDRFDNDPGVATVEDISYRNFYFSNHHSIHAIAARNASGEACNTDKSMCLKIVVTAGDACVCNGLSTPDAVFIQDVKTVFAFLETIDFVEYMTSQVKPLNCSELDDYGCPVCLMWQQYEALMATITEWDGALHLSGTHEDRPYYVAGSSSVPAGKLLGFPVWAELYWTTDEWDGQGNIVAGHWQLDVNYIGVDWTYNTSGCPTAAVLSPSWGGNITWFEIVCDPWYYRSYGQNYYDNWQNVLTGEVWVTGERPLIT